MEADKSSIWGVGQLAGDSGKSCSSAVQVHRPSAGRISTCLGEVSLCSIQAFNCLDEAHHGKEGPLLYSRFTILNVNLIQQTPSRKYPGYCLTPHLGTMAQPWAITERLGHMLSGFHTACARVCFPCGRGVRSLLEILTRGAAGALCTLSTRPVAAAHRAADALASQRRRGRGPYSWSVTEQDSRVLPSQPPGIRGGWHQISKQSVLHLDPQLCQLVIPEFPETLSFCGT